MRITYLQERNLENFYLYELNEGDIWMSADLDFLDALLRGLDDASLEWAAIRIARILESRHPEIIARKTIIRKQEEQ